MKNFLSSVLFIFIIGIVSAQSTPKFDVKATEIGHQISLNLNNMPNIASVKVVGQVKQNGTTEQIDIRLTKNQVEQREAFKHIKSKYFSGKLEVIVTFANGKEERFPAVGLSVF